MWMNVCSSPFYFFLQKRSFVKILLWCFWILTAKEWQASLEGTFYFRIDQILNREWLKVKDIHNEMFCLTKDILFRDERFSYQQKNWKPNEFRVDQTDLLL